MNNKTVDYNRTTMGFKLYDSGEIELIERKDHMNKDYVAKFYFQDAYDLAFAIKQAKPELAKELIKLLEME